MNVSRIFRGKGGDPQVDLRGTKNQQLFRLVESHDNKNKKSFGHCPWFEEQYNSLSSDTKVSSSIYVNNLRFRIGHSQLLGTIECTGRILGFYDCCILHNKKDVTVGGHDSPWRVTTLCVLTYPYETVADGCNTCNSIYYVEGNF